MDCRKAREKHVGGSRSGKRDDVWSRYMAVAGRQAEGILERWWFRASVLTSFFFSRLNPATNWRYSILGRVFSLWAREKLGSEEKHGCAK